MIRSRCGGAAPAAVDAAGVTFGYLDQGLNYAVSYASTGHRGSPEWTAAGLHPQTPPPPSPPASNTVPAVRLQVGLHFPFNKHPL